MARQDLGKIVSEITSVNVTVDNNVGVPSAEASISGTLTEKEVTINFKNLKGDKGDKPVKGTDYFTEEEKQQFTTETVGLVTAEGEKQVTAIGEKGTTETQKVTAEGTKQTNSVKNQGTTSLNAVKKVQTDIEALLNNQTASGNALSLNGKTGVQYDKEIQGVAGGYSGNFPLTTADLNGVYLLPSTGKFYVCIKDYNGTQISAPNANFEELSVYKNRDKLDNLYKIKNIKPKYISDKIEYPQFFVIGNLLFYSFRFSKPSTFKGFEKLIELPDEFKFIYNQRMYCGEEMIYCEMNTGIIKNPASRVVDYSGNATGVVFVY